MHIHIMFKTTILTAHLGAKQEPQILRPSRAGRHTHTSLQGCMKASRFPWFLLCGMNRWPFCLPGPLAPSIHMILYSVACPWQLECKIYLCLCPASGSWAIDVFGAHGCLPAIGPLVQLKEPLKFLGSSLSTCSGGTDG